MEVTFAHICDYAIVSQDGKLSIMGIFDQINAPKMPAIHPSMYLAFQIALDYTEVGKEFRVSVEIVDEDGDGLVRMEAGGMLQPPTAVRPSERTTVGSVVPIMGLEFKKYGNHDVNIFLNGQIAKRVTLRVAGPQTPPRSTPH